MRRPSVALSLCALLAAAAPAAAASRTLPQETVPAHARPVARGQACPATSRHELVSRGAAAGRMLVRPGARSVRLCRYAGLDAARPLRLTARRGEPRSVAAELTSRFDALHAPPAGPVACPNDFGTEIVALFAYAHRRRIAVTVGLTGCPTARNGVLIADAARRAHGLLGRLERLVG
jgi:hypothetical protein